MQINRKQILETFTRIVSHISDKNYQRRVWILGEGPEVDDFDETICHFFQEGEGIIQNYKEFEITDYQYQLLKKFSQKLKSFSDANDFPEEFIDTPEWAQIINLAKDVLKAFNHPKSKI